MKATRCLIIAAAAPVLALGALAGAQVHTVSNTDFSGTQGLHGWHYGFWDRTADSDGQYAPGEFTEFAPAAFNGANWAFGTQPPNTAIFPVSQVPNGADAGHEQWVIRRWVSNYAGLVNVSGNIRKTDTSGGDGTRNAIYVNGSTALVQHLLFNDGVGTNYSVNIPVSVGTTVDIVTTPKTTGVADRTRFIATIQEVHNALADGVQGFSGVQGANGWSYGRYTPTGDPIPGYQTSDFVAFAPAAYNGARWDTGVAAGQPRTIVDVSHVVPNDNAAVTGDFWAIRRWTSTISGDARVRGSLQKVTPGCGDGTTGAILRNGQQVWTATIGPDDVMGVSYDAVVLGLVPGDIIDFVVKSGASNTCDYTRLTSTFVRCPSDYNQDGIVNSNDFFDYVRDFVNGNIAADFNHDGTLNTQDFFDFIAAFFSFC